MINNYKINVPLHPCSDWKFELMTGEDISTRSTNPAVIVTVRGRDDICSGQVIETVEA